MKNNNEIKIWENYFSKLKSIVIIKENLELRTNFIKDFTALENLEIVGGVIDIVKFSVKLPSLKQAHSVVYMDMPDYCPTELNWKIIKNNSDEFIIKQKECETKIKSQYIECHPECDECYSADSNTRCVRCKNYKIENECIQSCEQKHNGKNLFEMNGNQKICGYCDSQCRDGCYGPVSFV